MPAPHAELLSLHGPDAIAFAHAQFSSDIRSLETGHWQWSAWLDPQGRVRALFNAMRLEQAHLLLLLRGGEAHVLAGSLRPYVMRSRVEVEAWEPRALLDAATAPADGRWVRDEDRAITLGMGTYALHLPRRRPPSAEQATPSWCRAAIDAGHPWLPEATPGKLLAPALALQRLGGLHLDKGCYPGQEIVARLHYRGGGKQHLRHLRSDRPLAPGTPLTVDGQNVGTVLNAVESPDGGHALAVVRDTMPHVETRVDNAGRIKKIMTINIMQ